MVNNLVAKNKVNKQVVGNQVIEKNRSINMKSVLLFYFSGTGNTEIVAKMIRDDLSDMTYSVDMVKIEDYMKKDLKIDITKYDLVGIGSQVIGFGVPNLVRKFAGRLPKVENIKTFIFRTAGGVTAVNYNASKPLIRQLRTKGFDVFHERLFSIGSNWTIKFQTPIMKQLHEATAKKAKIMCGEIVEGKPRFLETGAGMRITSEIIMFIFPRLLGLMGRDLAIDSNCSSCGLCARNCPSRNIQMKDKKVRFGFDCSGCMRCVYACPNNAIRFKHMKAFYVPGGYNINNILSEDNETQIDKNQFIPPFFSEYILNDSM